jgi:thiol-disulfide isomerase/thioredoxin
VGGVSFVNMKIITAFFVLALAIITARSEQLLSSNTVEMNALKKALIDAHTAFYSTNDESGRLYYAWRRLEETNLPQMLSLAKKEPESQPACDVFLWIALNGGANRGPIFTNQLESLDYLTKYHSTNSKVGPLCSYLGRYWSWQWREKSVVDFLNAVVKNNPVRANRAQAIYALGCLNANKSEQLAAFENWSKAPFYAKDLTTNDLAEMPTFGSSQQATADAEQEFKEIIANYDDCLDLRELRNPKEIASQLKKLAEENLFSLQNLSLGNKVPDIKAEGVDGKKFKLSDSRGKICMLTFWASWCGPCMQMVPVERALAERMQGKSFAMIGVNGDSTIPDANRAMEREKMTWPSFWNGKEGPGGPISKAWNVDGWPTIFVLDSEGIIRFKYEGYGRESSNVLNGCVDELMKTLPAKKP